MNVPQKLSNLLDKYNQLDRSLLQKEGEFKALLSVESQLRGQIGTKKSEAQLYEKAGVVAEKLTELSRKDTLDKVAAIATTALQEVKDPNLEFKIQYKRERNQAVAEFIVYDSQLKQDMSLEMSCGGTIVDIVELPLKVSLLLKWRPELARLLVLDESFKQIATEDRPKFAQFMRQLAEKLDLQIILVTHSTELASQAHKVFKVSKDGTESQIQELTNEV